jgi:hypothetical protein
LNKDLPEYTANWRKIKCNDGPVPCPRTSQSCVAYKNRYMIVIGGETDGEPAMISRDAESSK